MSDESMAMDVSCVCLCVCVWPEDDAGCPASCPVSLPHSFLQGLSLNMELGRQISSPQ